MFSCSHLSLQPESSSSKVKVSNLHKRKHQITALFMDIKKIMASSYTRLLLLCLSIFLIASTDKITPLLNLVSPDMDRILWKEEFARGEARHGQDFVATLAAVTFSVRDGNGLHTGLVTLSSWGSHVFATSSAEASRKFSESSSSVTVLSSFVLLQIMYVVSMTKP
uniref:Uncharacterized protein n=1 Tax=Brassica oleracea var. oleracea TaxID=109376 RepID=A0A0D3A9L2_BRAOL